MDFEFLKFFLLDYPGLREIVSKIDMSSPVHLTGYLALGV